MKKIIFCMLAVCLSGSLLAACGSRKSEMVDRSSGTEEYITTELTVFTLKRNKDLEGAANAYEAEHPEVKISFDNGKTEESDLTQTEILKNLNTAILNGEGPDIICFDNFSADSYRDMLADLSDVVEKHEEDCFSNVLRSCEDNGEIKTFPVRFGLAGIGSSQDNLGEIDSIGEMYGYINGISGEFNEEYLANMLSVWFRAFAAEIENVGEVSEESVDEFYQFFNVITEKSSTAQLHDTDLGIEENLMISNSWSQHFPDARAEIDTTIQYLNGDFDIREYLTAYKEDGWEFYPLTLGEHTYFLAESVVGVNCKSKNMDAAESFLDYTLSKEGQLACNSFSMPVNREAMNDIYFDNDRFMEIYYTDINGKEAAWKIQPVSEEMAGHFNTLAESVDTPISNNEIFVHFLADPYIDYLDGKLPYENAVDTVVQKVNLYQMEKQ